MWVLLNPVTWLLPYVLQIWFKLVQISRYTNVRKSCFTANVCAVMNVNYLNRMYNRMLIKAYLGGFLTLTCAPEELGNCGGCPSYVQMCRLLTLTYIRSYSSSTQVFRFYFHPYELFQLSCQTMGPLTRHIHIRFRLFFAKQGRQLSLWILHSRVMNMFTVYQSMRIHWLSKQPSKYHDEVSTSVGVVCTLTVNCIYE